MAQRAPIPANKIRHFPAIAKTGLIHVLDQSVFRLSSILGQRTHRRPFLWPQGALYSACSEFEGFVMGSRSRSAAALLIDAPKCRPPPEDARARLAERDARLAADTRTDAEQFLGDPPLQRSALAQRGYVTGPAPRSASGTRVDLWKR